MAPHIKLIFLLFYVSQSVASDSKINHIVTRIVATYFQGCNIVIAGNSSEIDLEIQNFKTNPIIAIPEAGFKSGQKVHMSQRQRTCILVLITLNPSIDAESLLAEIHSVASQERNFYLFLSLHSAHLEEFLRKPLKIKYQLGLTTTNGHVVLQSYSPHRDVFQTTELGDATFFGGSPSSLFPDHIQRDTFFGGTLRISVPVLAKWFAELNPTQGGGWSLRRGINTGILPHLMDRFNFSGKYFPSSGGGGTGNKENGTWGGAVGDVVYGRADLTTPIGGTLQRSEAVQYSRTFNYARLTFVVEKPRKVYTWLSIYYPLAGLVWILFLVGSIAVAASLWIGSKVNNGRAGLSKILEYLYATTLEQSTALGFAPQNTATGHTLFVVTIWLLFTLVMTTAYKSKLMNSLLFPQLYKIPQNFDELAESDYTLVLQYVRGLGLDRLKASNNPTHHKIVGKLILEPNDVKCFQAVLKTKAACIAWYDVVDYIANQNFTDRQGLVPFVRVPDNLFFIPGGITMQHKSVYRYNFDKVIIRALDMGLFAKWFNMDVEFIRAERVKWLATSNTQFEESSESGGGEPAGLGLKNMTAGFLFLGIGLSLGILVFIRDLFRRYHQQTTAFFIQVQAAADANLNMFRPQRNLPTNQAIPPPD